MFVEILGFKIYKKKKSQILEHIDSYPKVNIISGNPEILFNGLKNEFLYKNFHEETTLIIPDGVGTVIASKLVKDPVEEKIAGIEVMHEIIGRCNEEGKGIYLLGAKEEVLSECCNKLQLNYPGIKITGRHNGYFDIYNCENIISDIKKGNPYAIFVAMGCPRQEEFIARYMNELPCKVYMGVGGSFDVIAGNVKRAPRWMINLGLEWLYRVSKEPWRIKRLGSIPKFLWMVLMSKGRVN